MLRNQDCLPAYVTYFRTVPWQLFCTFTFAWPVSDARAVQVFKGFIGSLEKAYGCPIAWVRGDEKRFSGCGKPGAPRHYHAVMAASRKLDRHRVADTWMSMAGYRRDGAGADVRLAEMHLSRVLPYLAELQADPEGWDFEGKLYECAWQIKQEIKPDLMGSLPLDLITGRQHVEHLVDEWIESHQNCSA